MAEPNQNDLEVSARTYKRPEKLHSPVLPLLWLLMPFVFCLLYGLFVG